MKSSNYVIYLKKRMDMGKCTSCILYIKQNPTTYNETTISQRNSTLIAAFLLESLTTNQSIPNNIIYTSLEIIEGRLIMSQQSLTQFFKSTSSKRKLQGPDGEHETTVTKKMQKSPSVDDVVRYRLVCC
jgi:hypothetical protein